MSSGHRHQNGLSWMGTLCLVYSSVAIIGIFQNGMYLEFDKANTNSKNDGVEKRAIFSSLHVNAFVPVTPKFFKSPNVASPPTSSSFEFQKRQNGNKESTHRNPRSTSSVGSNTQLWVMDKMSADTVNAITTAQFLGNDLNLRFLRNELLAAGIANSPGKKAGVTLARYNLFYPLVRKSAMKVLENAGFRVQNAVANSGPSAAGTAPPRNLPFSEEAKITLSLALRIANNFKSETVEPEHLLLALMGYDNGNPIDIERVANNGAYDTFRLSEGITTPNNVKFSPYDFCEDLIQDLNRDPNDASFMPQYNIVQDETVIINNGSLGASSSTLDDIGVDLTLLALQKKLDKVNGRNDEIRTALRTLGRRRKNNPVLIGDPGIGKTAIVEAIAQVVANSYDTKTTVVSTNGGIQNNIDENPDFDSSAPPLPLCPDTLLNHRIISIELASLVAGTRNRGDFEERVKKLIEEASNSNIVLFIDEIHNLIGTGGGGDGAMNAANILKPALARGELRVIGATTTAEYRKYIEKDSALERRFQPCIINEPTVPQTVEMLNVIADKYAEHHGVTYTENALIAAAKLSDRYVADRFLPDKAIDLIDEAGSMVRMSEDYIPQTSSTDDNTNTANQNFVTEDDISTVISEITGIPLSKLDSEEKSKLRLLESEIKSRVKGQDRAVRSVARSIRRARAGMADPDRPIANLFFCGPTGVGKTELSKALAQTYFGRQKDMIRIDMSEYGDRFSTSRLVGAPPGYVGYDEGGQLTEAVRRKPHSVVLFDEMEKAHPDVLNVLLQIMDEGTLTDGKGRRVNFKNTILIMTSNVGSKEILEQVSNDSSIGNGSIEQSIAMARVVKEELEKQLRPELLNRMDEIVVFSPLSFEDLQSIAGDVIDNAVQRALDASELTINVDDSIVQAVAIESFAASSTYGARPVKRACRRFVEETIAEAFMKNFITDGDEVYLEIAEGVTEINGVQISEEQVIINVIKYSIDGRKVNLLVPVEEDAGIGGSVKDDKEWRALYGDLPSLDDVDIGSNDADPSTENDASWG